MAFGLTSSQSNFYTKNIALDSTIWNQGVIQVFPKVYSYKQLNDAYNALVKANDSLRATLIETEDGVVAEVQPFQYVEFPFLQVETDAEMMQAAQDFLNSPTDLSGRLVRCTIFQTATTSGVMISGHHLMVDGYSAFVMSDHINHYIQDPDYMPPAYQTYAEYVEKEEKHKKSKRFASDCGFWREQFQEATSCDYISGERSVFDFSSSEVNRKIPAALMNQIKTLCKDNEISAGTFFNTVYATYIHRKYQVDRFTIGVPVLNRTTQAELNTIGLYMHLVPLVIHLQPDSFLANAQELENAQLNLFRHQKFTQQDIKALLKEDGKPHNTLFDFVADFQEFDSNEEYEMRIPYSNTLSVPVEIHLQRFNEDHHNLKVRYRTAFFTVEEAEAMADAFLNIAKYAVERSEEAVTKVPLYTEEALAKALTYAQGPVVDYPKNKLVHQLFEAQAAKTPDTVAVVACDKSLTYAELNKEASNIAHALVANGVRPGDFVAFDLMRKSYVFSAILGILKAGAVFVPINYDDPADRKQYVLADCNAAFLLSEENIETFLTFPAQGSMEKQVAPESNCYCIYTSGSTGNPKGTLITHKNAVNLCHSSNKHMRTHVINEDYQTICSFATVGFDMFIAECLLPLLNGMTIVFANENQSRFQKETALLFETCAVDIFQCTPSKLKLLTADKNNCSYLKNVKAIIIGGEAFDIPLFHQLQTMTDAVIYNFYGPTEATVWATYGQIRTADDIHVGKPMANTQVYIVDQHLNPVPAGVTGEICIAGDCVGAGYLNRLDLTTEKFIDNPFGSGKLYRTGDIGFWREDGNIDYVGRNDFQVKIRGLRIELGEIETAITNLPGIHLCATVVRQTEEERQLICAFYTGEETTPQALRNALEGKLPKYMIPHIFTHLEEMPLNTSGKINRKALPEIELENIETDTVFVAPETEQEQILVSSVEEVLECEKVSLWDNFFDLGGDSLTAIALTSKLEEFGYTIQVKNIFEAQNMQALAKALAGTEAETTLTYDHIMPATPAQMRIYTSQLIAPDTPLYNIPDVFKVEDLDVDKLEMAVNALIARHESLRTHFENQDGVIMQVIDDTASVNIVKLESDDIIDFVKPFDLTKSPLLRVGCYNNTVMIDIHHSILDGESLNIFHRELNELYMGRALPAKPVQYGEFAVQEPVLAGSEQYWLSMFAEEVPELTLPTDYARKETQSFHGSAFYDLIDIQLHEQIKEKAKDLGVTPYAFYMACFNIFLAKYSGNQDIVVGMPVSGRSSKFLDAIGMFVNTIALRSKPEGNKTIATFMQEVRDTSVTAMEHQNYPLGNLVKNLHLQSDNRNPLFDVMFVYQSEERLHIVLGDKQAELIPVPVTGAKCDFNLAIVPRDTDVVIAVEYCTDLYKEQTIRRFVDSFKRILAACLDEQTLIQDISAISEQETKTLLYDFNDTATTYPIPDDATIYSLFAQRAVRTPEKKCISTADTSITFSSFLSLTENLDAQIRAITKGKKSIIAVIAERSVEMYSAIYGIIRGGNAYLPIAPDYPQERIAYILKDSGAALVIAQEQFAHLAGDVPCLDMTAFLKNTPTIDNVPPCIAEPEDTAYVIYTSGSTGNPKGAKISHKSAINRILWMHDSYPMTESSVILQKTPYTFDVSVWELFWWGMCDGSLAVSKPGEHFLPAKILEAIHTHQVTHLHFVPSVFDLFLTYLEAHQELCAQFQSVKHVFLSGEALSASSVQRFYALFDYNTVKLHNLYGPTECAVDVTYYDCKPDDIDPVPIGRPIANTAIYILDQQQNILPQGVMGELCIGGVNVGQGYLNNPTLTAEKFIDNPFADGRLYRTGDLAYIREDGQIIFCGRMDHQIKLNGQRIELGEIENAMAEIHGVEQCAVIVRKDNDNRQFICAFYTGEETDAKECRAILSAKLPKYMVPHTFTHLEEMPMTASGKTNRNALPEVDCSISTEAEYVAPNTPEERALAEVVCSVLKINSINLLDNFFNIGGDSINAIYIVSELEKMGYALQVADMMQKDTLSDVANAMKATSAKAIYDQGEVTGIIPFSPIMRAFLNESNHTIPKDFVHTCIVSADCDEHTARIALDVLTSHHDILRGTFSDAGIKIHPSNQREAYALQAITIADTDKAKAYLNSNINIDEDKLINVVFCHTEKENLISITIHHFLIDLISWEVLMEDFKTVVKQLQNKGEISLPAKTASFMLWNEELQNYAETISHEQKAYWENINGTLDNAKSLCADQENEAETYGFTLDTEIANKLIHEVNNTYGTRTNEVLLTALGLAAETITDGSVGIIVESHGRTELHHPIAVERTMGWFTSCYPVVVDTNNVTEALIQTKETMRRIPRNGIDYLLLSPGFHKNTDIIFNFYQNNVAEEKRRDEFIAFHSETSLFPNKISVDCSVAGDHLEIRLAAAKGKHKLHITEELGVEFQKQIEKLVAMCTATDTVVKTRSDFSDEELTETELDELKELFDWGEDDEE